MNAGFVKHARKSEEEIKIGGNVPFPYIKKP